MAIAVALLFKCFILEISRIPSGSMQPTLMGSPSTQVFDRILVDKLSFHYRDPERFEIVVFKHPLERSRIMVKRLVGMPDEEFKIEHGDLWTRASDAEAWSIARRSPAVQNEMWKRLEKLDRQRSNWRATKRGEDWRMTGRSVLARGDGEIRFRPDESSIRDRYEDGYPDALRGEGSRRGREGRLDVGDLRLEADIRALAGTESLTFTLSEGSKSYVFVLPGPAADEEAKPEVRVVSGKTTAIETSEGPEAWRLPTDDSVSIAVENLDDRLTLEIDGEVVLTLDVEPMPKQKSSITIALAGSGAEIDDIRVYRDIYYYWPDAPSQPWVVDIGPGEYVMLGDNTQDSADSRDWEFTSFTWTDDDGTERSEIGNYRPGMLQGNPVHVRTNDEPGYAFRDRWGDRYWFSQARVQGQSLVGTPAPTVPRELIMGRAVAVFWPIDWGRMMWRRSWLH